MSHRRRDETELLFQAAHLWVRRYYPGLSIEDFRLKLSNGRMARLPLPELLECVEVLRRLPDDVDPATILEPAPAAPPEQAAAERPARGEATHSRDFATVNWYGTIYSFTGMQRAGCNRPSASLRW